MMQEECPVILPPIQNDDAAIVHIKPDRTTVGYFQRKTVANLISRLNNVLQDSAVRIGQAPELYDAKAKWRMSSYGEVFGGCRHDQTDEEIDRIIKRIRMYESWRVNMYKRAPVALSVCERVCQMEESVNQIVKRERMDSETVIKLLQFGLNEYSIEAGWGDQINGKM